MRHLLAMTPRPLPSVTIREAEARCNDGYDAWRAKEPVHRVREMSFEPGTIRPAIGRDGYAAIIDAVKKQEIVETEAPVSWFDFTASYDIDVRRIVTSKDILYGISLVDAVLHLSRETHDSAMRPTARSAYRGYKEVDHADEYVLHLPGMPGEYGGDGVFDPMLPEMSTLEWPDLRPGDKLSIGVRLRRGHVCQVVTSFHLVAEW